MSHEIRTPLHQIIGLTEDLSSLNLPEHAQEVVGQLRSSGTGLFELLNGILDFSKIEAGKLEIERSPFNLYSCLDDSTTLFSRAAQDKGIDLTLVRDPALPCYVVGDALRLRQILVCLISNAVKFTDAGHVCLRVRTLADDAHSSTIQFSVVDNGIGISEEKLGKLFSPFEQGDTSTSRKHGGTGLGLTIARSLVQLMGGDLSVESRLGQGTAFQFSISFERATPGKETAEPVTAGSSELRILIAEDNKINQKIMLNLLARIGYKSDLAADGAEAIAAVRRQTYDVILMDIQMPKVDGLEATRAIRRHLPDTMQPRIFAVTAHATTDDRQSCLNAGMDGYFTKPLNRELLERTLAEIEKTRIRTRRCAPASTTPRDASSSAEDTVNCRQ
jgi:CheY-like chemotaxis protein/anti-sigma regulatory factor (Ser/Thr protein kinase)